jgi:Ran-binding protein 1
MLLSSNTAGLFQFGQPVHGFTPMSFNFSLPSSDTLQAAEPELPSHSGPCVVTTGGVTYSLEQIQTQTLEEDEECIFVDRVKLYRYDNDTHEWKERGVGDYKVLKHRQTGKYRIIMRRDKILKLCANHSVSPYFTLKPHPSYPETCWVYQTDCDYSDEVVNKWTLAVRFRNPELTKKFKDIYEQAQLEMTKHLPSSPNSDHPTDRLSSPQQTQPAEPPEKPQEKPQQIQPAKSPEKPQEKPKFRNVEVVQQPEFNVKVLKSEELNPAVAAAQVMVDKPLTLGVIYAEILDIKSTLKTMQDEWIELKNIIIASQRNK